MAWIPIYADENDFLLIMDKLNQDPEIAFIAPNGRKKWIAVHSMNQLRDGTYYLWHMPGGPIKNYQEGRVDVLGTKLRKLFNVPGNMLEEAGLVKDPFKGWKGPHQAGDKNLPFLGNEPNIIELNVRTQGADSPDSIGLSSFGWIGNRYQSIGLPAAKETTNWWRRLKNWMSKTAAEKIPRSGPLDGPDREIWAFPSAHKHFLDGKGRDLNPLA